MILRTSQETLKTDFKKFVREGVELEGRSFDNFNSRIIGR